MHAPARDAFYAYVAPGPAPSPLWRLLAGLALVLAFWVAWTVAVMLAVVAWRTSDGVTTRMAVDWIGRLLRGDTPAGVALALATFAGIWPGVWLAQRLLHGEGLSRLFSVEGRLARAPLLGGLAIGGLLYALTLAAAVPLIGPPGRTGLEPADWAPWLALLAPLVLVQAGGEELIFRGYMLRRLAEHSLSPWVWAVLPALLFGMLHWSSGLPGAGGALYVAGTALFGVAAALLVWRTGGLAASIGLHAGINLPGLTLAALDGLLDGAQLWSYPARHAGTLLLIDTVAAGLLVTALLALPGGASRRPPP